MMCVFCGKHGHVYDVCPERGVNKNCPLCGVPSYLLHDHWNDSKWNLGVIRALVSRNSVPRIMITRMK